MKMNRRAFVGGCAATLLSGQELPAVPEPQEGHPRLYFRPSDLQQMRARLRHPLLVSPMARLRLNSTASVAGTTVARAAEIARSCALLSVLEENERLGRTAVSILLDRVPAASWNLATQDVSREIGLVMLSAGMVYDWCFRWLDGAGPALIAEMYRLAAMLEVGYPPTGQGANTGHAGEAMLLRDLLGTGLAIYQESPEMYRLSAGRILREFVPARAFFYPSATHHQGSAYGPYRYRWEVCAAWIFERAGLGNPFPAEQGTVPYRWVYTERPDGRLLPDGDVFNGRVTTPCYLLAASLYRDSYLQDRFYYSQDNASQDPVEMVTFFDTEVAPTPARELPLSRYFGPPFSGMVLRTGWNARDDDPALVELKIKEWHFNNHQHLDAGAFQIWYRAPLAMDTGLYRTYFSPHDGNYLKRTVAHNCVLLVDPEEGPVAGRWAPDGGQRWPNEAREARTLQELNDRGYRVATTIAQQIAAEGWAVLEGDLSAAYAPSKAELHRRSFVYVPAPSDGVKLALVVFDRVRAAKSGLSTRWLLHTASEPVVSKSGTVSTNGRANLVHQALLPEENAREFRTVGGTGAEFMVGDRNYPADATPQASDEAGSWRLEVCSTGSEPETLFLNLLQVTAYDGAAPPTASLLQTRTHAGVLFGSRAILLSLAVDRLVDTIELELPQGEWECLITGLARGAWVVTGAGGERTCAVTADGGVASFAAPGGPLVLTPRTTPL